MVRERIARVRYERTMTMREPKDEKAQGFDSLLTEEEKAGLSEEEKMKRIAAKMEEKFKSEQRRASTVAAVSRQRTGFGTWQMFSVALEGFSEINHCSFSHILGIAHVTHLHSRWDPNSIN